MKYHVNVTVTLEKKHCLECPLRCEYDECLLQDCSTFNSWEDQLNGCPLVSYDRLEALEKALRKIADIDAGTPIEQSHSEVIKHTLRSSALSDAAKIARQALEGGDPNA